MEAGERLRYRLSHTWWLKTPEYRWKVGFTHPLYWQKSRAYPLRCVLCPRHKNHFAYRNRVTLKNDSGIAQIGQRQINDFRNSPHCEEKTKIENIQLPKTRNIQQSEAECYCVIRLVVLLFKFVKLINQFIIIIMSDCYCGCYYD